MKCFEVILIMEVVINIVNLFTSPIITNMLIILYDFYPYTNNLINLTLIIF